jgi:hypothetical protein
MQAVPVEHRAKEGHTIPSYYLEYRFVALIQFYYQKKAFLGGESLGKERLYTFPGYLLQAVEHHA